MHGKSRGFSCICSKNPPFRPHFPVTRRPTLLDWRVIKRPASKPLRTDPWEAREGGKGVAGKAETIPGPV